LVDKADRDVLVKDTKIYAHSLLRLIQDEILPLDLKAQVAELRSQLAEVIGDAEGHIDLSSVSTGLGRLESALSAIISMPAVKANAAIKTISHALTGLSFTYGDRFDHDPAMPLPEFPSLAAAKNLSKYDPESNEHGFLLTRLVRNRNMVNHEIKRAIQACDL
jgi:uncharacterized protein YbcC (UPF0753/DUF2309 family)